MLNPKLKKQILYFFTWALALSIALPIGIMMVVFGAIGGKWVMLGFGALFVVIGFYIMPLLWVSFATRKRDVRIVNAIIKKNVTTLKEVEKLFGLRHNQAFKIITNIFGREYIIGFKFVDDSYFEITDEQRQKDFQNYKEVTCVGCGASVKFKENQAVCPYCGKLIKEK